MSVNVAAVRASRHLASVSVPLQHFVVVRRFMMRLLVQQVFGQKQRDEVFDSIIVYEKLYAVIGRYERDIAAHRFVPDSVKPAGDEEADGHRRLVAVRVGVICS